MNAADTSWSLTNRRDAYVRFLTAAQSLHIACEEERYFKGEAGLVPRLFSECFTAYGVIQTAAADTEIIEAARLYAWRLRELRLQLAAKGIDGADGGQFGLVSVLVRSARHTAIDAMRADLGLEGSSRPDESKQAYNPFQDTDLKELWQDHQDVSTSAKTTLVGLPFS